MHRAEKINIKTITQKEDRYYYIQKALIGCFNYETIDIQEIENKSSEV